MPRRTRRDRKTKHRRTRRHKKIRFYIYTSEDLK